MHGSLSRHESNVLMKLVTVTLHITAVSNVVTKHCTLYINNNTLYLPISFAAVEAPTISDRFGAMKFIRDST